MKKAYFKVGDLKEYLKDFDDDTEIFVKNTFNMCGNISALAEVKLDSYSSFGEITPCLILDTDQNVEIEEEESE